MTKRVVVAGMGDTGVLTAGLLARHHDVVAISTKPRFVSGQELGARLARPDQWRRDYLHRFEDFRRLRDVEVVHGAVASVDLAGSSVRVETVHDGPRTLEYDALVIATGTTNGFWRTAQVQSDEAIERSIADNTARLLQADSIAVVGGGPSGVSAASHAADVRGAGRVTLFHSGDLPLAGYHARTRTRVVGHLVGQGVRVAPNHRAVVPTPSPDGPCAGTVEWSSGQEPTASDLIVWAVGHVRSNTEFLPPSILDDRGFVKVDPTFLVSGQANIFAIGDVAATDPLRSSARNFGHRILAHNVERTLQGQPERMRAFRAPRHRWGSVLGLQADGMRIETPQGRQVRLNEPFTRRVLFPLLTHRLLYGGLRRDVNR